MSTPDDAPDNEPEDDIALVPGVGRAIELVVQQKTAGMRLDQFLVLHCQDFSRSILQKLFG